MPAALVEAHRLDLEGLLRLAEHDLEQVWQAITSADQAREALQELLPQLAETYGLAAATLAADWYDELREALEVPGRFRAIPAEPEVDRAPILARWGIGPLFGDSPDFQAAKTLVAGGFQRLVADADRHTVAQSSVADSRAEGWQRVGSGKDCTFCRMLIGRGAVYSEASADFASHDHCNCTAVPAFAGQPRPVRPFTPSTRDSSDADRARVREYLRTH